MAWGGDSIFTPHVVVEYDSTYNELHHIQYNITFIKDGKYWKCCVHCQVRTSSHHLQTALFPKDPQNGLYFSTCTCGADKTDVVLCDHMAAVAHRSRIPNVTPISVMPIWRKRERWTLQIPSDVYADVDMTIQ